MAKQNLVNEIILMIKNGYGTSDILKTLKEEGNNMLDIREAIEQAQLKIELAKTAGDDDLSLIQEDAENNSNQIQEQETWQNNQQSNNQQQNIQDMEAYRDINQNVNQNMNQNTNQGMNQDGNQNINQNINQNNEEEMSIPSPQEFQQRYPERFQNNFQQEENNQQQNIPYPDYSQQTQISQTPYPQQNYPPQQISIPQSSNETDIEEMIDEIINEKVNEIESKIGNLDIFRQEIRKQIIELEKKIKISDEREENKKNEIMNIIQETNTEIKVLNGEIFALENAFSKILAPLVSNIKDIKKVIEESNKIELKMVPNIQEIIKPIETKKIEREETLRNKKEKDTKEPLSKRKKDKESLDELFIKR